MAMTELQKAYLDTSLELGSRVPPDDSPIWRQGSVVKLGHPSSELIRRQAEGSLSPSSLASQSPSGTQESPGKSKKSSS